MKKSSYCNLLIWILILATTPVLALYVRADEQSRLKTAPLNQSLDLIITRPALPHDHKVLCVQYLQPYQRGIQIFESHLFHHL